MAKATKTTWKDVLQNTEGFLDEYLGQKAPNLGTTAKKWLVSLLPWLALIFGFLGLVGSLGGLGCSIVASPFWWLGGYRFPFITSAYLIFSLLQSGLELLAVPSLLKQAKRGWELLFYSALLGIIPNILHLSHWGLILILVELYLLFQVKNEYR